VHGFERQRFQNEHVQSALNEITRLVRHGRIPPEDQGEEYTSPTDCQEENHDSFTLGDNSKGDGRSLHYGLSAPPYGGRQAFVPVSANGDTTRALMIRELGERTTTQSLFHLTYR